MDCCFWVVSVCSVVEENPRRKLAAMVLSSESYISEVSEALVTGVSVGKGQRDCTDGGGGGGGGCCGCCEGGAVVVEQPRKSSSFGPVLVNIDRSVTVVFPAVASSSCALSTAPTVAKIIKLF